MYFLLDSLYKYKKRVLLEKATYSHICAFSKSLTHSLLVHNRNGNVGEFFTENRKQIHSLVCIVYVLTMYLSIYICNILFYICTIHDEEPSLYFMYSIWLCKHIRFGTKNTFVVVRIAFSGKLILNKNVKAKLKPHKKA